MVLSQTAEYAIRVMHVLSLLEEGGRARAIDLGPRAHIPAPYLSKLLARLVKTGLVDGVKGHHGGFRLAKGPEEISLAAIIGAVEDFEDFERRCFFGFDRCTPQLPCALHPTFEEMKTTFLGWANNHTLADIRARDPRPHGQPRDLVRPP